ncbi:MAG: hypothetical protein QG622_1998 [Actinomycetota bacterium]|nr:hypothetical protein [Actinomycetota bacterium]
MISARAGVLLALAVAGWPLYQLVATGSLDLTSALLRGLAVAAACTYGIILITRLAQRYEQEIELERRKRLNALYTTMQNASAEGALGGEGTSGDEDSGAQPPPEPGGPPGQGPAG